MGKGIIFRSGNNTELNVVTANAPDVIWGKVIVDKNGDPLTGIMKKYSGSTLGLNRITASDVNSRISGRIEYTGYYDTTSTIYMDYSNLALALNLSSNKIAIGRTILGIAGQFSGMECTLYGAYNVFIYDQNPYSVNISISGIFKYNYCICKIQNVPSTSYYPRKLGFICAELDTHIGEGLNYGSGIIMTPDGPLELELTITYKSDWDFYVSLSANTGIELYSVDIYIIESATYLPLNSQFTTE